MGGQALASPGPLLHGARLSRADLWVATVPGHKDAEVAAAVARRLCIATGEAVSVAAGIHIDDATPEQIEVLRRNCLEAADAATVWIAVAGELAETRAPRLGSFRTALLDSLDEVAL